MTPISSTTRTSALAAAVILVACLSSVAQSERKQAIESPLSTAIYLLSETAKDDKEEAKTCLAKSLVRANRIKDLEGVANTVEPKSYVDDEFIGIAEQMIKDGREKEASVFVSYLLKRFDGDGGYYLKSLIGPLIKLRRENEIIPLIDRLDNSDKIDLSFEVAASYRALGKPERALAILTRIVSLVEVSEYPEDKAVLAFHFASLGEEPNASRFIRSALAGLAWTSGKPEYTDGRVLDRVIETYKLLGKHAAATELLVRKGEGEGPADPVDEARELVADANRAVKKGDRKAAFTFLERGLALLRPHEYGDSFALGDIVEIYLELGDANKAEMIVRGLTGNEYMRQTTGLKVAEHLANTGNRPRAYQLLQFALEQTKKIDTSEPEDGRLWTSGKWDQARYESQIAVRLIAMGFDNTALAIIAGLKKPYLKALILTEYVAVNRKRIHSKKLVPYLEQALRLLNQKKTDIFDSKRFDVLAITARNFAAIGMPARANEVFAETLTKLDAEVIDRGTTNGLIFAMCNIGVDFEKSQIKASDGVKAALLRIVQNWENDEY